MDPDSVLEPGNYLVSVLRIHPVGLWQLKLDDLGVEKYRASSKLPVWFPFTTVTVFNKQTRKIFHLDGPGLISNTWIVGFERPETFTRGQTWTQLLVSWTSVLLSSLLLCVLTDRQKHSLWGLIWTQKSMLEQSKRKIQACVKFSTFSLNECTPNFHTLVLGVKFLLSSNIYP